MPILVAFIAVPLIEIALFIQIGGLIGLWPTLLIVVLTALAGTALVRSQGALALAEIRRSFRDVSDPSEPLAKGAMVLFAGALLLTPGFFTDAAGFALLIPAFQKRLFRELRSRVRVETVSRAGAHPRRRPADGTIIDGEAEEIEIAEPDPNRPPSGWTRGPAGDTPPRD